MTRPALPPPDALAAWIPRQRWFAAKARRIRHVVVADSVPLGPGVVLLVDLELDDAGHERYAIPLLVGDEIRDALRRRIDPGRMVTVVVAGEPGNSADAR